MDSVSQTLLRFSVPVSEELLSSLGATTNMHLPLPAGWSHAESTQTGSTDRAKGRHHAHKGGASWCVSATARVWSGGLDIKDKALDGRHLGREDSDQVSKVLIGSE